MRTWVRALRLLCCSWGERIWLYLYQLCCSPRLVWGRGWIMKARKKQITVYLTTDNEEFLDEYRQSQGTVQYSRAVNDILTQFFQGDEAEENGEEDSEERLRELEMRLAELEVWLRVSQDWKGQIEELRSQVTQLTERCDRLLSVNTHQQQALLQAREREHQFRQQLSETIHTVQTRTSEPIEFEGQSQEDNEEFDILDAELVDSSTEDLLFKLSQELGLI